MAWIWVVAPRDAELAVLASGMPVGATLVQSETVPSRRDPPLAVIVDGLGHEVNAWTLRLQRARASFPGVRAIVIASFDRESASRLLEVGDIEVVWEDEMPRLAGLLRSILRRRARETFASFLAPIAAPDPLLADAVWLTFRDQSGPLSVRSLASRLHISESALRARWKESALPSTPRATIDWFVVCAVADARRQGQTIETVARQLGIHASTIHRICRRVLDCTPAEVDEDRILFRARDWLQA